MAPQAAEPTPPPEWALQRMCEVHAAWVDRSDMSPNFIVAAATALADVRREAIEEAAQIATARWLMVRTNWHDAETRTRIRNGILALAKAPS